MTERDKDQKGPPEDGRAGAGVASLLDLVRTLRGPRGCPWDRRQTDRDLTRYLLEEAHEVVDAVNAGDPKEVKEEIGDLLFQVLFLCVLAEERGEFTLEEVCQTVREKMIRRHPHVFGRVTVAGVEEVKANWETIKREVEQRGRKGIGDGIPRSLPALRRAQEIQRRAAAVGFDWPDVGGVWAKVAEELEELKEAALTGRGEVVAAEMGDCLFTLVNLCRFLEVEAEESLRGSVERFIARFAYMERRLREEGKDLPGTDLQELDRLWEEAKDKG
ncbi:MAG TPA: nucleoside triphosphate pyrophosphohydrolase [Syntrophales bacterium]|nr:nucleoside triphosphate pyrophosphohydrolase [Syntrophales bacterium]HPC00986.1 nucleoside triphosphate pyrophosphohydrolase [Syntrophales bacterium]HRS86087.1 nucleoside triphosphate pyrophosphohydrolase [Syntrophales bacterium]HRV41678.1 nucleoside triphosphate pyrophosphohydrolase [Syntrophales bacterium]